MHTNPFHFLARHEHNQYILIYHLQVAKHGHIHLVDTLLLYGADINAQNNMGNTPLHVAASHNQVIRLSHSLYSHLAFPSFEHRGNSYIINKVPLLIVHLRCT